MEKDWVDLFLSYPELNPNRTGHASIPAGPPLFGGRYSYDEQLAINQRNLGLGWLYYSLTRTFQIKKAISIGSGRGFVPILLAKGIQDNGGGVLHFIDPSFDDDFWKEPEKVKAWFEIFGVEKIIKHYRVTTQQFSETDIYRQLNEINLVFIDGSHKYEDVKIDFNAFKDIISDNGFLAFHDTISRSMNPLWQGARKLISEIANTGTYQVFDFKLGAGFTLVQKVTFCHTPEYLDWTTEQWANKGPYGW